MCKRESVQETRDRCIARNQKGKTHVMINPLILNNLASTCETLSLPFLSLAERMAYLTICNPRRGWFRCSFDKRYRAVDFTGALLSKRKTLRKILDYNLCGAGGCCLCHKSARNATIDVVCACVSVYVLRT